MLAIDLFGVSVPWWYIAIAAIVLWVFRAEVAEVFRRLWNALLGRLPSQRPAPPPTVPQPDETTRQLIEQTLREHGINPRELGALDGQSLISLLESFVAFLGVVARLSPNRVDDAFVTITQYLVEFLKNHPDVAAMLAGLLRRLAPQSPSNQSS